MSLILYLNPLSQEGADCRTKQTLSSLKPKPTDWWQIPWAPIDTPMFAKCPYSDRCVSEGCRNGSSSGGVLCAVCAVNYYESSTKECILCTNQTVPLKIAALTGVMAFIFLVISVCLYLYISAKNQNTT